MSLYIPLETARLKHSPKEDELLKQFKVQFRLWQEVQNNCLVILRNATVFLTFIIVLNVALQLRGTKQRFIENALPHFPEPHVNC
ncbi:MAG: hypothetical protein QOH96_1174 [Blastocatellia bacterium]|nr:hypothetical protein [Blastocatellia bacterium]